MYFICELCRMLICILFVNSICIFKDCFSSYFYVSFFQHCHVWLITMSSHILGFQNFQTTPLESPPHHTPSYHGRDTCWTVWFESHNQSTSCCILYCSIPVLRQALMQGVWLARSDSQQQAHRVDLRVKLCNTKS